MEKPLWLHRGGVKAPEDIHSDYSEQQLDSKSLSMKER